MDHSTHLECPTDGGSGTEPHILECASGVERWNGAPPNALELKPSSSASLLETPRCGLSDQQLADRGEHLAESIDALHEHRQFDGLSESEGRATGAVLEERFAELREVRFCQDLRHNDRSPPKQYEKPEPTTYKAFMRSVEVTTPSEGVGFAVVGGEVVVNDPSHGDLHAYAVLGGATTFGVSAFPGSAQLGSFSIKLDGPDRFPSRFGMTCVAGALGAGMSLCAVDHGVGWSWSGMYGAQAGASSYDLQIEYKGVYHYGDDIPQGARRALMGY